MRDAFGGVFTMRLMIVFIFIFVAFTAISLNYAKAFRIKNKIIDFIEQEEITDLKEYYNKGNNAGLSKLDNILSLANYNKQCKEEGIISKDGEPQVLCYKGIIIEKTNTFDNIIHYTVKTYAGWDISTLNLLLRLSGNNDSSNSVIGGTWEISGEAKVVITK